MDSSSQPIATLNPFLSSFTIKARVTSSRSSTYTNAKGKGHLTSYALLDSHGGEIELTLFNADSDRLSPLLQVHGTYFISNGQVRQSAYTKLKNQYQIIASSATQVIPAANSPGSAASYEREAEIPAFKLSPLSLEHITHLYNSSGSEGEKRLSVDLVAVALNVSGEEVVKTRKGSEIAKRTCLLVDESLAAIEYTAWAEGAAALGEAGEKSVIALKGAAVGSFSNAIRLNGGQIIAASLLAASEHAALKAKLEQFISSVDTAAFKAPSAHSSGANSSGALKRVGDIERELLGQGEKTDYFDLIGFLRVPAGGSAYYDSCGRDGCKKKVVADGNDFMFCSKCQSSSPSSKAEFLLSFSVADCSGSEWVSAFGEVGKELVGVEAERIREMKIKEDEEGVRKCLFRNNWEVRRVRCGAKSREYNGESSVRVNAYGISKVDWVRDGYKMIEMLG